MEAIESGSEIGDWWMRNKQVERFVKPSSRSGTEESKGKKWRIDLEEWSVVSTREGVVDYFDPAGVKD